MADRLSMQIGIEFETFDKVNNRLNSLLTRLQKANKLNIEVDTSTFEKLEKQFNQLKEKINKNIKLDVNADTVNQSLKELDNTTKNLQKKQIKIVDDSTVQIVEQVKKSLIETDRIVKNLNSGSSTITQNFDYAKVQTSLYNELNNLQKSEFQIKQQMIGQDEKITQNLEEQLNLVRQRQIDVGKGIVQNNLQSEDGANQYLVERQKLTSDLTIAQEKYNKKMGDEALDIQNRIRQYQTKMSVEIQNLQTKYRDIVPSKQLSEFQSALSRLNGTSLKGLQSEIKDLDNQFKQLTADTKSNGVNVSNQDARGMTSLLSKDLVAFASWKLIGDGVMLAYRSIGDSVKFVYDMDTAMVSLKKITQETSDTYRQFAVDSNEVARSVARGTTEVVDATVAWKKAGYSLNEAKQLSATTLIGANVGDVDVKSIQQYLVAPLKAWNITAEDSIKILNIMNNVSNQHAVTIQDLGESYSRASSVMALANNTLEETTALVTAAQAKTQMGGDTIGNGLRTIALRLTQMKDEEGNIIPKLAEDFEKVGVHIKDANGNLNSTFEIIRQLNKVWGTLSADEQLNLLEKAAGKQRSNILAAMITNFDEAEKTLKDSLNSTNSAINEQNAYLQSLEAKTKIFKESANGLYQNIISADDLKNLVDSGTGLINMLSSMVKEFGALPLAITAATSALMAFDKKAQIIKLTPKIDESGIMSINFEGSFKNIKKSIEEYTKSYTKMLEQQMMTNGIMQPTMFMKMSAGLKTLTTTTIAQTVATGALKVATFALNAAIGMGIGLLISFAVEGIMKLVTSSKKATETLQDLSSEMQNVNANSNLINQYKELNKQIEENTKAGKDTTELKKQQLDLQKQLAQAFPEAIDGYTKENEAIVKNIDNIEKLNEAKKNQILATAGSSYNELYSKLNDSKVKVTHSRVDGDFEQQMPSLIEKYNELSKLRDKALNGGDQNSASKYAKELEPILKDIEGFNKSSIQLYSIGMKNAEIFDYQSGKMVKYSDYLAQSTKKLKENTDSLKDNANAKDGNSNNVRDLAEIEKDFAKSLNDNAGSIKEINSLLEQHQKVGEWNFETILKLAQEYPDLLEKIGNEGELEKRLIEIKQEKVNAVTNGVKTQMSAEASLVNSLAKGYGIDVDNMRASESEKIRLAAEAVKKRSAIFQSEARAIGNSIDALKSKGNLTPEEQTQLDNMMRGAMRAGNLYTSAQATADAIDTHLSNYLKLQTMASSIGDFTSNIGSSNYDGKKNSSADDAAKKAEELRDKMKDDVKSVEEGITEIVKKEFEKRKEAIEDEYNARKDAVQKEKNLYDKDNEEDDYQKNLKKEQEKLNSLNASIVNSQRDTSLAGKTRTAELVSQAKEQQDVIDNIILEHTRKTNDQLFDDEMARLDKEKEAKQKSLEDQFSDENISKMVNEGITTGQIKGIGDVLTAYKNFQDTYNNGLMASGQLLETEFIDKWKEVQKLINGTAGVSIGVNFGSLPKYAEGGVISHTGLAWVDGTPSLPELALNGKQAVNVLRNLAIKPFLIPNVSKLNSAKSINFNQPFMIIQGDVTKDMLPDLESFIDKAKDKVTREIMQSLNNDAIYYHP